MKSLIGILFFASSSIFAACSSDESEIPLSPWVDTDTPLNVSPANEVIGKGWKLVFSDEFNDGSVNLNKWTLRESKETRTPRPALGINEWYYKPENVFEKDGVLSLKCKKVGDDVMYGSAITSEKKYLVKYGYLEARVKNADIKKAIHTAFWMSSPNINNVDGTGNDGAEIDIFESAYIADKTLSSIHIDGYGDAHQEKNIRFDATGLHEGFHVWGLLWNENKLEIYYDGVLKATFDEEKWIPRVEEYILFSAEATFSGEGDFRGQPVDSYLTEALVDYIRVWSLEEK